MVNTLVAYLKVNELIGLLGKDRDLLGLAKKDVRSAFSKIGVEITESECLAVEDVLKGESNSSLAAPMESYENWVANHRQSLDICD